MTAVLPGWLDPGPWAARSAAVTEAEVSAALAAAEPAEAELGALLSPAASRRLEELAARAQALTWRHFGRTISLYVPLYLSDYCSGGCRYCGFASDRRRPRHRLEPGQLEHELAALKALGFEEVLLLTGERTPQADFAYLAAAVETAARQFHAVTVEAFPMAADEYRALAERGCTGVTLYQETYDRAQYDALHRWGPKKDYDARLDAPRRILESGMRFAGLGVLLGLSDPVCDALALFQHAQFLRRQYWRSGISLSFPRVCRQTGDFEPAHPVDERRLAQWICAFRICLPDVPLVLSTRESARFRDGMAGLGISKMSAGSRTTVGGYAEHEPQRDGQFEVNDDRSVDEIVAALRAKGLEPVFKNWEAVYRE
jgi:2-iminoacetate synthase